MISRPVSSKMQEFVTDHDANPNRSLLHAEPEVRGIILRTIARPSCRRGVLCRGVETRGHALGHCRLTAAGGSSQSNDEDALPSKTVD